MSLVLSGFLALKFNCNIRYALLIVTLSQASVLISTYLTDFSTVCSRHFIPGEIDLSIAYRDECFPPVFVHRR
ncbi:MAG TPA: hypothetical protein ACQGQH_03150 [Xylella sp.]